MGKNLYGALAYNQNKVDEGGAKVLWAHLLRYPEDGRFRPDESMRQFLEWMPGDFADFWLLLQTISIDYAV